MNKIELGFYIFVGMMICGFIVFVIIRNNANKAEKFLIEHHGGGGGGVVRGGGGHFGGGMGGRGHYGRYRGYGGYGGYGGGYGGYGNYYPYYDNINYTTSNNWIYDDKFVCHNVTSYEDLKNCLPAMRKWTNNNDMYKWRKL